MVEDLKTENADIIANQNQHNKSELVSHLAKSSLMIGSSRAICTEPKVLV